MGFHLLNSLFGFLKSRDVKQGINAVHTSNKHRRETEPAAQARSGLPVPTSASPVTCGTDHTAPRGWRPSLTPQVPVSGRLPAVSSRPDRSAAEDAFLPFSGVCLLLSPALSDVMMHSLPAHHTRVTALVCRAAGLRVPAKSLDCGAMTTPEA